jgi:hypothetical protein
VVSFMMWQGMSLSKSAARLVRVDRGKPKLPNLVKSNPGLSSRGKFNFVFFKSFSVSNFLFYFYCPCLKFAKTQFQY